MLKIVVGHSEDVDTLIAVKTVLDQCRHQLGNLVPQAGMVFAGIDYEQRKILTEIRARYPGLELVGCTTAGEISSISGNSDDSIGLVLIYSDTLDIKSGIGRNISEDPAAAIRSALAQARSNGSRSPSLCLIFPDSYNPSFQAIVDSLNTELGPYCPVFGGGAGTLESEKAPLQFYGDEVLQNALPFLLFFGELEFEFNVNNSWRPLGMRARATDVSGTTVRKIGDMQALEFYRYYVGPHGHPAAEFPLAVFDEDEKHFYVRTPMDFDEDSGSVSFAGPIPEGATVQLTEATREQMVAFTQNSIETAFQQKLQTWQPSAALVFSCVTRKGILGTRTPEELQILKNHLPANVPIMGFYSFGEFSPLQKNQISRMHSSTMVTLLLGEKGSRPATTMYTDPTPVSEPRLHKEDQNRYEQLQNENLYLKRKLKRSETYRQRLETTIDLNASMLKKINRDVNDARLEIEHKNELLRQTLELADEIQKNMLPRRNPHIANFQIAGKSVYCSETGGDYFDFLKTEKGFPEPFSVLVGDVTGHGIEAALLMTTARALIRSRALQPGSIAQILTEVNQHLAYDIDASGRFMTMFYLNIDPRNKRLDWVRAGHDPAIFYDPATDTFEELGGGSGIPLGVDKSFAYEANEKFGLAKDQIIFIGTDGIWETHNPKGEMFGKQPVLDIIRANALAGPQAIIDNVIAAMNDFRENLEPQDDATLVALKVEGDL